MKEKVIISDIDGVAIDWLQGFINYMESTHKIFALHDKPSQFGMNDIFPGVAKPWEFILDYQHSEFYLNLDAYEDAQKSFKALHNNGFKIILLSSCGDSDFITKARTENIEDKFGDCIEELIMLPYASSKTEALLKLPQGAFIEDQMKVAIEGVQTGKTTFIRNMPYNVNDHHDQVTRINSFLELPNHLKKINPELFSKETFQEIAP